MFLIVSSLNQTLKIRAFINIALEVCCKPSKLFQRRRNEKSV